MEFFSGETVPLSLVLGDYATGLFPRARVYNGLSLITTINLAAGPNGYYFSTWTAGIPGRYEVVYEIYADAGHTVLSTRYDAAEDESVHVRDVPAGQTGSIRQSFTLDTTSNAIIVNVWLEVDGGEVSSGVTNATLVLYASDGTVLETPAAQPTPVVQGVFRFSVTIPSFPLGENATFSVATIDYAGPPSRTVRGVTGVTFSRSS